MVPHRTTTTSCRSRNVDLLRHYELRVVKTESAIVNQASVGINGSNFDSIVARLYCRARLGYNICLLR